MWVKVHAVLLRSCLKCIATSFSAIFCPSQFLDAIFQSNQMPNPLSYALKGKMVWFCALLSICVGHECYLVPVRAATWTSRRVPPLL